MRKYARLSALALFILAMIIFTFITTVPIALGTPSLQIDPTHQQQTVYAMVDSFFTQTAAAYPEQMLTQTVQAAFSQALTGTAVFQSAVQTQLHTALTATAWANQTSSASQSQSPTQLSAVDTLNTYVRWINAGQFTEAYALFLFPRTSYRSFVEGWRYTEHFTGHFGEFQPYRGDPTRGSVPALLIGEMNTGIPEVYNGCYFMIQVNNTWYIEDASFKLLYRREPTSAEIAQHTTADCSNLRAQRGLTTSPIPQNIEAIAVLRELNLPVFRIGYRVKVAVNQVNVRSRSTSAGERIAQLNRGDVVTIIGGPLKSIRFVWWKVELENGQQGWIAAFSEDGTPLLQLP